MRKVLLLTYSLSNGGAERQLALLSKYLTPQWDRKVWALSDGVYDQILRSNGNEVFISERSFRYDVRPAIKLWQLIIKWRPSVLHSWSWMSTLAALPICKLLHIPLIDGSIRTGAVPTSRSRSTKFVLNFVDKIIANSYSGLQSFNIESPKGVVVYNGFDMSRIDSISPQSRGNTQITTVIMTGRMSPEKDFATFINAARILSTEQPQKWKFIAMGNGPNRQDIINSSKGLIDQGFIEFPKPSTEVLDKVLISDIGVLLSNSKIHAEGCSNSIMEYMASGLPVICTNNGGNPEIVKDGETGFLINNGDVDTLVSKLIYLRDNPIISKAMGFAGSEIIREAFSVEKMVANTEAIYNELSCI